MSGGKGLRRKIIDGDHYLFYFYLLRLKGKIVKNNLYQRT